MTARRRKAEGAASAELYLAEPPASYRVLAPLVVDCSLLGAVLFDEPQSGDAQRTIAGRDLHAPTILDYEVVNVALKKSRLLQHDVATPSLEQYGNLPVRLHSVEVNAVARLAQRYRLSAYDAAYLWLAEQLKAPLATFDRRLGEAARQHLSAI